jgi:excisionase family DNA binding protein
MRFSALRGVVTITVAARLLGVSVSRVRYLVDAGRIPAVRDPAGRRLLRRRAVMKLARERGRVSHDGLRGVAR